ncbi:MAG: hypothetical protein WEB13_04405, partial [Dehalococcoidia bacterium]
APVGFVLPAGAATPEFDFFIPDSLIAATRFQGAVSPRGVSLVSFGGGTVEQLSSSTSAVGAISATVFVGGRPVTLIPGAPAFVNSGFTRQYPALVPAGSLIALVK